MFKNLILYDMNTIIVLLFVLAIAAIGTVYLLFFDKEAQEDK